MHARVRFLMVESERHRLEWAHHVNLLDGSAKQGRAAMGTIQVDPSIIVAAGSAVVGALAWLFRLEGRITVQEKGAARVEADIAEIKADVKKLLTK